MHVRAILALVVVAHAASVTIDNLEPRRDNTGAIMDAHDGSIQRFNGQGPYYYHAASYGLCKEPSGVGCDMTADHCGFQLDHNISIYKSLDLSSGSWEFVGYAISVSDRPTGVLFRPHAVFNPNTQEYVLWWNYWDGNFNGLAVASASTPEGPFAMRNAAVNITRQKYHPGDFALFVDDDGTGYVIYSAGYWMIVEKLTRDYFNSTGETSALFPEYFVEAPAFFKIGSTYYALFGHCCCYCMQGSGIFVYTAKSPLGPWTQQAGGNLACYPPGHEGATLNLRGIPTPGQGCLYNNSDYVSATRSQQNFVIEVATSAGTQYVWTGDRWQQAPDGIKGHDPQFWVPLQVDSQGVIGKVHWVNQFTINNLL